MGTDSSAQQKKRHGFSLVEAAIVLAVVGLVIGGIWIGSAKFYEDYKVNKTVADLQLIVRNTQGLISSRDAFALPGITFITSTLRDARVFPKDWVIDGTVNHPFGGSVSVFNSTASNSVNFGIELHDKIPKSACIKLITIISAANTKAGSDIVGATWQDTINARNLNAIRVDSVWITSTFPITPEQAETACTSATDNRIYFYFGYTHIN